MSDPAPKKPIKTAGTVFDVKRPGKALLQPTSRPVIVGHKPMVRDPLTTGKTDTERLLDKKSKPDSKPVEPMPDKPESAAGAASPELAAVAAELSTPAKPQVPPVVREVPVAKSGAPEPEPEWVKPEDAEMADEHPKDFTAGAASSVVPPEPPKKHIPLSPELRAKMEEEVRNNPAAPDPEGVVVAGEHGPINFAKVFFWFVSVVLLVAVVGDVLLDAGMITTTTNIPHTHFIKK